MLTHKGIWAAIDALAVENGYSASGLARAAGLDPTTFNKSKRMSREGKPRWPSTESIAKILSATGSNLADLVGLMDEDQGGGTAQRLPVIGIAQAADPGYFDEDGLPRGTGWDEVLFPDMGDPNAYALEVSGDGFRPFYRDGDILIASPNASLRRGDRIVAKIGDGEVVVRALTRKTALRVELAALTDETDTQALDIVDIHWIARIVWASQ